MTAARLVLNLAEWGLYWERSRLVCIAHSPNHAPACAWNAAMNAIHIMALEGCQ